MNLRSCPPTWKRLSTDERFLMQWIGELVLSGPATGREAPHLGRWGTSLTKRQTEAAKSLARQGLVVGSHRKEDDGWYLAPTEKGRALLVWLWRRSR